MLGLALRSVGISAVLLGLLLLAAPVAAQSPDASEEGRAPAPGTSEEVGDPAGPAASEERQVPADPETFEAPESAPPEATESPAADPPEDAGEPGEEAAPASEELRDLPEFFEPTGGLADLRSALWRLGRAGLLVLSLVAAIWIVARIFNWIYGRLSGLAQRLSIGIRLRGVELVRPDALRLALIGALRIVHLALSSILILVAAEYVLALFPESEEFPFKDVARGLIRAGIATLIAVAVFRSLNRMMGFLRKSIPGWRERLLPSLRFQNVTFLTAERLADALGVILQGLQLLFNLALLYAYLATVFGFFDATSGWASALFGYIKRPIVSAATAFLEYVPNLFFILLIVIVARYAIRIAGVVFKEVERGRVTLEGFYPEWARPTHRLLSFVLITFAAVLIFPYLPGAESQAFQGISIFLGFLISLGSSALIANVVSGVVITYMRPFRTGDRVKIADTEGDVLEKTLLVTRIRTAKNVDVTIPNGMVLASHIINYSSSANEPGLILHTTVTIGYDVPHGKVRALLMEAATKTEGLRPEPPPFVLQTSLDDYYVSYQLNAYTRDPNRMNGIYSELHANILDCFHAGGVEIMSPHFYALRDGSAANVPAEHLPSDYTPPPFRTQIVPGADKPGSADRA